MSVRPRGRLLLAVLSTVIVGARVPAQSETIAYRLSFADRAHRLMDVEITVGGVPAGPLQLRMSRSSPGRYALHEFAKNVFDVRALDSAGRPLAITRPDPYGWTIPEHPGNVRVTYRIFGDRTDGTYLGIDSTHAHINMPAALMWARGLETRPVTIRFEPPGGSGWKVATQLLPATPTGDPFAFTAPNLQYLMDSPAEVSNFAIRSFQPRGAEGAAPVIRIALHHDGTDPELDALTADVRRIVEEAARVFGEFPSFDGGTYTFIADYLPWVNGDGMEHRNSTVLTSPSSLRTNHANLIDTMSHEFFHSWNIERIRPRSLEPFDFERVNMSGELWLGEGFTNYYGPLVLRRAGLTTVRGFAAEMGETVNAVLTSPGRQVRSAREMSEMAGFVDAASAIDRTSFENTFVSYYTWGAAIALGLDLTLRERSDGRATLDDFMRTLWQKHGKPGGRAAGLVDRPYTMTDLEEALAAVSGDASFAREFFRRYIDGRETVDYARLLARSGIVLRSVAPGQAFAGMFRVQDGPAGVRIMNAVPFGSPAYEAGLDRDDVIVSAGGARVSSAADWGRLIQARKPGDSVPVTFLRRGETVNATLRLIADPRVQAVPAEDAGQPLSDAQRAFRDRWLMSASRGPQ